jgi:hypothetical protein
MSEQKIGEFRERAQAAVPAADPDQLLRRGRTLRHRRQLAPVVALAACAAIGIALLAPDGRDTRSDVPPAGQPTVTETPATATAFLGDSSDAGTYSLDVYDDDGRPDATVTLVGDRWQSWSGGAYIPGEIVSWGLQRYQDIPIDQCHPGRHATSISGAVTQLSQIPGKVTRAPRPVTKLTLPGTYLQLKIPVTVECPNGEAYGGNLMAIWDGSSAPTVTVDVWLLEDGDRLLILTRGVRGTPSEATVKTLDQTLDTLRYEPAT